MKSLKLTHIIRGIVIPIIVALVFSAALFAVEPMFAETMKTIYTAPSSQKNDYERVKYNSFKELKTDNAVGYLSSSDFKFSTNVLYSSSQAKYSSLGTLSTEPWNGGCAVVYGKYVYSQLRFLDNANIGDSVTFDIYNHEKYTYKIKKIINNQTEDDIKSLRTSNTLLM